MRQETYKAKVYLKVVINIKCINKTLYLNKAVLPVTLYIVMFKGDEPIKTNKLLI